MRGKNAFSVSIFCARSSSKRRGIQGVNAIGTIRSTQGTQKLNGEICNRRKGPNQGKKRAARSLVIKFIQNAQTI